MAKTSAVEKQSYDTPIDRHITALFRPYAYAEISDPI